MAGSSVRVGSSTASAEISSVDFTSLTPRPCLHPRPRPITTSMSIYSSSSSVDINSQVAIFLADTYRTLDNLKDRVRAARSCQ